MLALLYMPLKLVKIPQGRQPPEKGNEGEEGDDENDNGHVSERPHCESKKIQVVSKRKAVRNLETTRSCLPSSRITVSKEQSLVVLTRRLICTRGFLRCGAGRLQFGAAAAREQAQN